jgi:hypothetical protein
MGASYRVYVRAPHGFPHRMTTVIAPLSLNLNPPRANRITPGNFEGSAPKPAPPCDHIPLGRRCAFQAASVGGLFHFSRRRTVLDRAPAKGNLAALLVREPSAATNPHDADPRHGRCLAAPETTGRSLNTFQQDWLLSGCKRTVGPFHRRVVATYALEVGAAGDSDNRDHSFSAFSAASRSIHDLLLDFYSLKPRAGTFVPFERLQHEVVGTDPVIFR